MQNLLDNIKSPQDLKKLSLNDLPSLASQLRDFMIENVSKTGGHLGSSLGVIELTIALHYIFNAPKDKIIWDVGHQAYAHKILTGRKNKFSTLRQKNGISGFPKISESEFDAFGTGHSSTSISAALGFAIGRDIAKKKHNVISVIGDGALSGGMAFEAMNNAGASNAKMIVVLNDNEMSISKPVGALSGYLSAILSSPKFVNLRQKALELVKDFPVIKRAEGLARSFVTGGTLFEQLGFYYIGPIDGHNFDNLIPVFRNLRDAKGINGPVLVHIITQKGKGFEPAEKDPSKFHGVTKFDPETGEMYKTSGHTTPSYTDVFADALINEAKLDKKILAITAAMPAGTGLDKFQAKFPRRYFDVGIAEQHAVTFAAGLAAEGYKPFVAIYSSFLQRAYDQIIHDVALQNLPVKFAIDRCGLVGSDGATHNGNFDIAYLSHIPNMVVMAPADQAELVDMITTAAAYNKGPIAFRYPRGKGYLDENKIPKKGKIIPLGKSQIVKNGKDLAIFSLGSRLEDVLKAADIAEDKTKKQITVINARFAKPLDTKMLKDIALTHKIIITVEEGSIGGYHALVSAYLNNEGLLDNIKFRSIFIPDKFINHADTNEQLAEAGLDDKHIEETLIKIINEK